MRTSSLVREKWDAMRGSETYLRMTILNAIQNLGAVSLPRKDPEARMERLMRERPFPALTPEEIELEAAYALEASRRRA
jgi:hypothetical protein